MSCFRALLISPLVLLSACQPPPEPVTLSGVAFFSMPWQVKVAEVPSGSAPAALQRDLQKTLDDANRVLSTYQPDTELMRFNATPVGKPVVASPMLFQAFTIARHVSMATDGVYDITVGPLVDLWGFGPKAVPLKTPDAASIAQAQQRLGWRHVELEPETLTLKRLRDVQADLSSLGEGMGVDALARRLEGQGMHNYMVSVAGTLRIKGHKPDGSAWQIAVEKPDASGLPQTVLNLQGPFAISTSGSYRNYHEIDGVRYSHSIDPRTGRPITHRGVSVTVVMPLTDAAMADAWATALNVLGPDAGLPVAEKMGVPAYYLVKTSSGFEEKYTPAFRSFLMVKKP